MGPALLRAALVTSTAMGLVDLAWLDANAARLAPPAVVAAPPVAPPPPAPPAPPPVTLSAARVEAPAPSCVLRYATNDDAVPAADEAPLAAIAAALARDPAAVVDVDGHADRRGPAAFNLVLSERRAAGVARWLSARGVARERIRVRGFGAARPVDDGDTEDALGRNRRVEVHLETREP